MARKESAAQPVYPPFPKAEDICKIISACKDAGVSVFKMGPVEILFGILPATIPYPQVEHSGAPPTPGAEVPQNTIRAQQEVQEVLSLEEQEIETKERRIAELLIEDPLQAEELMRDGDLEATPGDSDGNSSDAGEEG